MEKEAADDDKKLELKLDILSRYLWRGQCWGGDYVAVQPTVEYKILPKLTLGFWATTNFRSNYFYSDGSSYKGYQEIDFYAAYQVFDFLELQLWDYYWPSVSKVDGVDNGYFNYGKDGVKTVDATLYFEFSKADGYKFPFNATISTLVAGNDFRYDSSGSNPKQNFTTYLELGYAFTFSENKKAEFSLLPVIGTVVNNKAKYYTYANYDKVSVCNLGIKAEKEFDLGHDIKIPVSLNFTHNAASQNTEVFGRNFLVAGLGFKY
ncbi:MAG: hypothetical protein QM710_12385 [Flavobacterium sp.]